MFEPGHRCRLDLRADALELTQRVGVSGRVRRSICSGVARTDQLVGGVRVSRTVGVGVAVAVGLARTLGLERAVGNARAARDGFAILTPAGPTSPDRDPMEDDLVASGRFVRIEARGERTGVPRAVTVGFVEDSEPPPGSLFVAAGSAEAAWASNLLAEPSCHVTVGDRSFEAIAEPLVAAEHARAVRELILRYGTPAEGLGRGVSFRLRPLGEETG